MNTAKMAKLIKESGYKTSYVAEYAGIAPNTLRAVMRGDCKPSKSVAKLIAQLLKVDESEFLDSAA